MTTAFGSIIDRALAGTTAGIFDVRSHPTLVPGATHLASKTSRSRLAEDQDLGGLSARWQGSTTRILRKARDLASEHANSMTAWARLSQAAFAAGELDDARSAALKTLRLAVSREREPSEDVAIDVPAAYVAMLVLIRSDDASLVEEFVVDLADIPVLAQLWISILIDQLRLDEARILLARYDDCVSASFASLRGAVYLASSEHAKAVTELRTALRLQPDDVDSALNLALAFWNLGSPRKAIRWARYASGVAPGRVDACLAPASLLAELHEFDSAASELSRLLMRGVVETPPILLLQARIAAGRDQTSRVLTLLRKAKAVAEKDGNTQLAAEVDCHAATFRFARGEIDHSETLRRVRSALLVAPESPVLVAMLADLVEKLSDVGEARVAFERLNRRVADKSVMRGIECRLAYLSGEFDQASSLALTWSQSEPLNEAAIKLSTFWYGALCEDWEAAADRCMKVWRILGGGSPGLLNAAVYSLALAGRGREAVQLLHDVDLSDDFVLKATAGLAHVAAGDVMKGLQLYRQAAQLAEEQRAPEYVRPLMTIHQAMGLKRLGILDADREMVKAGALPSVELPADWEAYADFRFLSEIAHRRGWSWPVTVD